MSIILQNLSKSFSKKKVLNNINAEFCKNKIYAIVGENGAGKSTLIKIISKRVLLDSSNIKDSNLKQLIFTENEKIKVVEQIPLVASSLSINENIFLGIKSNKDSQMRLAKLLKQWCPNLILHIICKDASSSSKFYTSLLNCLLQDFNVLILDEPTTFLNDFERERLFDNLQKLKQQGICVIVVTHSKKEIIKYADQVLLLQKGNLVKQFYDIQTKNDIEKKSILNQIELSIGQSTLDNFQTQEKSILKNENNLLKIQVKNLTCTSSEKPIIENINFEIHSSQVVMINGLAEAGLFTLEDVITGMKELNHFFKYDSGEFTFFKNSKKIVTKKITPYFLRKKLLKKIGLKVSIVASDKKNRAASLDLNVLQILYSNSIDINNKFYKNYLSYATNIIKNSGLKINLLSKVNTLSGGMLQRLILERELSFNPDFLILCEPFAGLDIEKRKIIIDKIIKLKQSRKAVLILSTEKYAENICDKIYKLDGGKLYG